MQALENGAWPAGSFAVLTKLPLLERLGLKGPQCLPTCLPQLTGLSELKLEVASRGIQAAAANAAVNAALQQLTQASWRH